MLDATNTKSPSPLGVIWLARVLRVLLYLPSRSSIVVQLHGGCGVFFQVLGAQLGTERLNAL